ncbi:trigger factor [Thermosporothrix hazakensis]|uniref:Trigger factor n=1 Tax=Thermosporothrix hazakensis TaxID=644383 RepID=A0A326TSI8_THEHA|nr:trigger factor [Thermosporothrix hazakensis]PZW19212.1 trigger factor [Thermosporothrix hazakensis]GCE47891.1 trigger factor [Thermosporothrix hazakensis]
MKVSVEKLPTSEAVLEVDLSWDEIEKASDKAFKKIVKQIDVPGFRRGKAPRSLVERRVGKEYIYQEGIDDLISEAYRKSLLEHELTPITQPTLDAPLFEQGQDYHCTIKVPVITPVELGDYHSLKFEREEASVTSEEVDKEIEALRERAATWEPVEDRPADYGDRVTVDMRVTSGEQKVSDLKDNPFELTKERVGLFTGMDQEVVGMKPGEEKSFTTTIPEDYGNEKLAGKPAEYTVKVHKIERKVLPELNDEFAAKVSNDEIISLEDLSKVISDNLLANKKRQLDEELRNKVVDAVIEQSNFTIHPLLIDEQVEDMAHQFSHMLEHQGLSFDQYLMLSRKSREEYMKELRPDAEKSIKRQLVLDAVAEKENIQVDPEEVDALFSLYEQSGQAVARTKENRDALARSYRREKAVSRLVDLAAGPDPDQAVTEEGAEENAKAAAEAAEDISPEVHNENKQENEESATSLPDETAAQTKE